MSHIQIIRYCESASGVDIASYHGIDKHWQQKDFIVSCNNNDMILLACEHQHVVGHIIQRGCLDSWDILDLYVIEEQRQQGVGRALVGSAQRQISLLSPASIFLEVASDNLTAQKLYRNNNFVIVGERKGYYRKGRSDAIQMRWSC